MTALARLQSFLRELFQFEFGDLDFGIYHLLHLRHAEVETFLAEQLPRRVDETFTGFAASERETIGREVSELAARIRKEIDEGALLPTGEIHPDFRAIKARAARELLDQYEDRRRRLQEVGATETQKAEVFNHLYAFFARYYDAGDFLPRRHYGARETHAVPYRGEETVFHWANKDQHYVKTAARFRDYVFVVETVGGAYRVRFTLAEAEEPRGNTKGDIRYFFPRPGAATWDKERPSLCLPFDYRLPSEKEVERYGKNSKFQEGLLEESLPKILDAIPDAMLRGALSAGEEQREGSKVPRLLRRLRHFTHRNTTDYFVHKNLAGFLRSELEFCVKDQILHLGDLAGELETKQRMLRVVREIAEDIITFLAQIEEVQKRLFEKRKFVLRTDYLLPIKNVPRQLWKEVVANKAQLEAWRELFDIKPKGKLLSMLDQHPTLVVNTAYFEEEFKERLVEAFEDLDEATDGVLIHAENYQALRFLERRYGGRVKCIYIDPPYNTGSDEFIYKDRYRHSTWLAMMEERLRLARNLLGEDGSIFISIDDNELANLKSLMNQIFREEHFIATVIWQKVYAPKSTAHHLSVDQDYLPLYAKNAELWRPTLLPRTEEANARYENPDNDPRGPWKPSDLSARNYYSKGEYEVTSPSRKKFRMWLAPPSDPPRERLQFLG
jgi:adenine-specific DNA-methyltransferase